jgi:hypothetical protein
VGLDRCLAQEELSRDFRVGAGPSQQEQDFPLPRGEVVQLGWCGAPAHVALDQAAGHARRQERVAAGDHTDRVDQIGRIDVLEQEAAGATLHRLVDVLVEIERRQDQDPRSVVGGEDATGRFEPIELGHPDVHQNDGGMEARCLVNGL